MGIVALGAVGCLQQQPPEGQVALVVVNGSAQAVQLVFLDGTQGPLTYQPCSSHSEALGTGRGWRPEAGGQTLLDGSSIKPLRDAPFTVIQAWIGPDGSLRTVPPSSASDMPSAPISFPCAL